jgi:hypothetical protein
MARACANCGTEVDDDALFCPTCGEPIDRASTPDLPPAPDWPAAPPGATSTAGAPEPPPTQRPVEPAESPLAPEEETRAEPLPAAPAVGAPPHDAAAYPSSSAAREEDATVPPWRRGAAYRSASPQAPEASGPNPPRPGTLRPEGFIRPPETLSGWLVGIGALVGALAMLLPWVVSGTYTGSWGLASGINLLFAVILVAVLVVVFLPHLVPEIPQRNLVLLTVALIGVGVGLDRLGLPLTGSGAMIFLIGMFACAAGAFLAELGLDRTVGGSLR